MNWVQSDAVINGLILCFINLVEFLGTWPDNYIKLWSDRSYKAAWCQNSEDYSVKIASRKMLNTYAVLIIIYIRVEKKNQLYATEWFIALIICSTCFGHLYAHHQEFEAICVLLPPVACDALVAGCWRLCAGQPAMRSG